MRFSLSKAHPIERLTYAVTTGVYAGEILVFIETGETDYNFLSIPKMINRAIPHDKFNTGIQTKILDIVEKLPRDVYKVCTLQYKKNCKVPK